MSAIFVVDGIFSVQVPGAKLKLIKTGKKFNFALVYSTADYRKVIKSYKFSQHNSQVFLMLFS